MVSGGAVPVGGGASSLAILTEPPQSNPIHGPTDDILQGGALLAYIARPPEARPKA